MVHPTINTVGLCAGVGMLDIGVHAALDYLGYRARTVGYVERDAYAAAGLLARMDDQALEPAPVWAGNLQDVRWERWAGCLDGIIAGFPCQPHSMAGNREGTEDDRWTWPEIVESIRLAGPGFAFLENVSGLRSSGGLDAVLEDLAALGMHAVWDSIRAADVGASHQRERVFILAYRDSPWEQQQGWQQRNGGRWASNSSIDVADAGNTQGRPEVSRGQQKARAASGRPGSAMGNAHSVGFGAMRHDQVGALHAALHDQELADAGGQGLSVGLRRARAQQWPNADEHGSGLFAPGPDASEWADIINQSPFLAPATESGLRVLADGVAVVVDESRSDQLRCVGNGVVALQAALAFVMLARRAGIFS